MGQIHVADMPLAGGIEGAFRVGARVGVVAAGDLATSVTAAKNAVTAKAAANNVHVADKNHALPVLQALDKVNGITGASHATGGSLTNIYADIPGDWNETANGPGL